jgi:probable F420-dependent oxidoreductase
MRRFRFGVNLPSDDSVGSWIEHCRAAESLGFDAVHAPDHLGAAAPFAMLAAAAIATERLRLGTYVLNNGFWNPHLLAREAATVDRLSGGRLELGLGLGYVKGEFDAAGIPWEPHAERVNRLERSIEVLDELLSGSDHEPLPLQRPRPPLMVGGHGERILTLAARRADIVAFTGAVQRAGARLGALTLVPVDEVSQRVDLVRTHAGDRLADLEFGTLLQHVEVTDDAEKTAAELALRFGASGLDTAAKVLANPFVKVGTAEEIAAEIIADRDRFGFSYLVAHGQFRDVLGEVVPQVRELTGESSA